MIIHQIIGFFHTIFLGQTACADTRPFSGQHEPFLARQVFFLKDVVRVLFEKFVAFFRIEIIMIDSPVEIERNPTDVHVVAFFVESGAPHPVIAKLWAHIPEEEGLIDHHEDVEISPGAFLPNTIHLYRYSGSLTTPPCSEKVRWAVIAEPIEFSQKQIETFEKFYSGNNRPLQPLNGRKIRMIEVNQRTGDK